MKKGIIKKIIALSAAALLSLSAFACSRASGNDYKSTTIQGRVSSIDDKTLSLSVMPSPGEGDESANKPGNPPDAQGSGDSSTETNKPGDSSSSSGSSQSEDSSKAPQDNGGTPPDKPGDSSSSSGSSQSEDSSSKSPQDNGGTPPDKPGDSSSSSGSSQSEDSSKASQDNNGGTPPDKPGDSSDNSQSSGNAPADMPEEESVTISLSSSTVFTSSGEEISSSDIKEGDMVSVTFDENGYVTEVAVSNDAPSGGTPGGGDLANADNGTAATTIEEDGEYSGEEYTSTGDDENALRVSGATVTLDNITVNKSAGSSSNNENGDFYGTNAGLLALNGATVTIKNATVNTSAKNGNGIFSYGEGTTVNVSDSVIRTTEDNSGGIQTTGGATTNAVNLDIETKGNSSAAIRSDRGGGTVNVDGGSYVTNGTGSPAVYSTADITVKNAVLTANSSEAVVVEGKNSVSLTDCTVTGSMSGTYGSDSSENIHNIMIYQSMSGDADVGTASFSMKGGSLTAKAGDMFYITNTDCTLSLENVDMSYFNDTLLRIEGNSSSRGWGKEGENGGSCVFSAVNQALEGNIIVDSISSLDFSLTSGSDFKGKINSDGAAGEVNVKLDSSSTWTLTGDSYITSFDGDISQVKTNGFVLYVNGVKLA